MTKRVIRVLAVMLALLLPILTVSVAFADDEQPLEGQSQSGEQQNNTIGESMYDSPDINELTGVGEEPEELSVTAGATYLEKAWYEYVAYSDHAVCSYRLDENTRLVFFDPYTYSNSMIMDVEFDATTAEFDTMSSYTISYSKKQTIESGVSSTDTNTSAIQTSGRDLTHSYVDNDGFTKTTYNHSLVESKQGKEIKTDKYYYKQEDYETSSFMWNLKEDSESAIGGKDVFKETIKIGSSQNWTTNNNTAIVTDHIDHETKYSDGYKTTTSYEGDDTIDYETSSTTDGWTELSARVTKTIGSSTAVTNSWSETEEVTVTKAYAATHFASDGITPLPWAIVHYRVQMPMKCCLQVKHSGEWVSLSTVYCLLTTVQGTCRAWMQNGQVYYEDWGNGEPVVATDFWAQFMTKEQLMAAYTDKLYPVGGDD